MADEDLDPAEYRLEVLPDESLMRMTHEECHTVIFVTVYWHVDSVLKVMRDHENVCSVH